MWAFLLVDTIQNQMPYPVYSFVIVEEVVSGEPIKTTESFKTVSEAKDAYNIAISSGKRAFLYEMPEPTSSYQNYSQPMSS